MVRRTYFSFHYERDVSRAWVVRNTWVTHEDREAAGFFDGSLYEDAKRDPARISRMIDEGLDRCSVTSVLIGLETATRDWVHQEIQRTLKLRKGLFGIYVNRIADLQRNQDLAGPNPFDRYQVIHEGTRKPLSSVIPSYLWEANDGRNRIGDWIETADALAAEYRGV